MKHDVIEYKTIKNEFVKDCLQNKQSIVSHVLYSHYFDIYIRNYFETHKKNKKLSIKDLNCKATKFAVWIVKRQMK